MQALRCVLEVRRRLAAERAFQQRGAETVALGRSDPRAATLLPTERKSWVLTAPLDRPADRNGAGALPDVRSGSQILICEILDGTSILCRLGERYLDHHDPDHLFG